MLLSFPYTVGGGEGILSAPRSAIDGQKEQKLPDFRSIFFIFFRFVFMI